MQHSPNEIKDKLVQALDEENNVVDMAAVIEVVTILEKMPITKDELERTRLGKYVNELRKRTTNESLAKRAKDLVRKWRKLIVPHDTGTILNGERPTPTATVAIHGPSPAHLPGPGPGSGSGSVWNAFTCASKPASPATVASLGNGRPLFRGKSSSPGASFHAHGHHRVASPAFLQCSSASTSPALVRVNNHSRPATPNAVGRPRGGGGVGSQYSSPTTEAGDRRAVHEFKPVSPACNSLVARTGTHTRSPKLPSGMTVTRDFVNKSSQPACSSNPVSPQGPQQQHHHHHHAADNHVVVPKRARPSSLFEDSNSCCSPPFPPPASQPAGPVSALANGVDCGDSMDSVPSVTAESAVATPHTSRSSAPHAAKKRNPRVHQSEHCDVLKEKIASHLRTPKVKTTAELIEELKARNSGTAPLLENSVAADPTTRVPSPCPVTRSSSSRHKKPASPTQTARRPVLPGGDEDMARTKTELMEKFLTDTRHRAPSPGDGKDPVDVILESLPPVNAEDARWESEEEEECERVERPVTEEVVQRLHGSSWEGVNGHYDNLGEFHAWNELLEKETLNGEMLRILPYVDID